MTNYLFLLQNNEQDRKILKKLSFVLWGGGQKEEMNIVGIWDLNDNLFIITKNQRMVQKILKISENFRFTICV